MMGPHSTFRPGARSGALNVKFILPALTEATDPYWRPIKYSLFPPLGLATLAAYLSPDDCAVLVDEHVEPLTLDDRPDLVIIQVYITNAYRAYRIADHYRNQGAFVCLGGLHATSLPEEAAPHCDALFLGPGEQTFPKFLLDFRVGAPQRVYASTSGRSIDRVPPIRRDLIRRNYYLVQNSIVVTRGCPQHCDFCYKDAFFQGGRGFYTQWVDDALAEIDRLPGRHLYFLDDHLLGDRRFAEALFDGMRGMRRVFQGAATVDSILRGDLVERAAEAGLRSLFVGFETLAPENLKRSNKRQNLGRDYKAVADRLHSLGIMINGSFVFGMDDDDQTVFRRTVDWAVDHGITTATFHIQTPYPGTRLHARMVSEGRIVTHDWNLYDTRHVVYRPARLAPETLKEGYDWAYHEFYRWSSIARASLHHGTLKHQAKHFFYASGWKRFEPIWDLIIRARQLTRVTPLLESVLSRVTRLNKQPPSKAVPEFPYAADWTHRPCERRRLFSERKLIGDGVCLVRIVRRAYSTRGVSRERESMEITGNSRRKCLGLLIALFACTVAAAQQPAPPVPPVDGFSGHPRVAIISDIGNEPDDQMSFVRLLLYSNELDLEAMIATTSTWQRTATHAETMHALIQAYGQVRDNLLLHAKGWPTAEELDGRVFAGQPAYGMAATGDGKSSAGSRALARAIEREDNRPLWVCLWGGGNTIAQALMDLRAAHTPQEMEKLISRLRISSISDQDDAGAWIRREFPSLFYIAMPSTQNGEEYYYATWTGISGDLYYRNGAGADTSLVTNEWLDTNIRSKGPLGKLYPRFMFIMEGDTPSFLGLIDNGLNAYRRPDWGGWGGRYVYRQPRGEPHPIWTQGGDLFTRATSQDVVRGMDGQEHISDQATIWRWREAYQNDFAARMDWTIKDFAHANHNPSLVVNGKPGTGPLELETDAGQSLTLDAAGSSDPDGQTLRYKWWVYPEAGWSGAHAADVTISGEDQQRAEVRVNSPCRPAWIPGLIPCRGDGIAHIILEVTDDGSPRLTSYRRIVLRVRGAPRK